MTTVPRCVWVQKYVSKSEDNRKVILQNNTHTTQVRAVVDAQHRASSSVHHTATHLLHAALRDVLGTKTGEMPVQAGSNVNSNMLTFDFTSREAMSADEIEMVQKRVNAEAEKSLNISVMEMGLDEATSRGAMAHFEDRYEDSSKVRVVEIGDGVSSELCCGTHVSNTSDVYPFLVLHERSVALGTFVRISLLVKLF